MSAAIDLPLGERLMKSVQAFLSRPVAGDLDPTGRLELARQRLAAMVFRKRDENTVVTPEQDLAKGPRLLCVATDEGRTKPYAPIRNFRLELIVRGNALTDAAAADPFVACCGALETLLDGLNLQTALSSADWQIAVMLAVRENGNAFSIEGDIRRQSSVLKVRAVGLEHTTS